MKKILVALNNLNIYNILKEKYSEEILSQDIVSSELVIEFLAKNKIDIVITKDTLDGEMTKEIYIKQLKMIAPNIKVILYVESLNEEYKYFLFANEVFNIIEDNTFDINVIDENIEEDKKKVYVKNINNNYTNQNIKIIKEVEHNVISKQLISVYGTSGAGKSYIASLVANKLRQRLKIKTLLWDMDVENSNVDIYNNINRTQNVLRDIVDEIDKGTFNNEFLESAIFKTKTVDFLTNNSSIYDYQEKLSEKYYKVINEEISKTYDLTVVDLPAMPLLDSISYFLNISSKIIFVLNPNYLSIRQALKYLEIITNLYDVSKNKINIVINKCSENSLTLSQVKSLLGGYEILMEVPYSVEIEKSINGIRDFYISDKLQLTKLYKLFGINEIYNKSKNSLFNFKARRESNLNYVGEQDADKYI